MVESLLDNPVYHALLSADAHLGSGTTDVRYFDEEVSPFIGIRDGYRKGFDDLYDMLPRGRKILYATPGQIEDQRGWQLVVAIEGLQFVLDNRKTTVDCKIPLVLLQSKHVEQMIALTFLTKPGPFGKRTIEFGHYYGIFEGEQLAAMTGQRLHVSHYSEISAVCTHPQHLGKGYAGNLMLHQMDLILESEQIPYLHVRADNERAIALYERLGFKIRGPMNFYFFKRE
jgi:ribosomal protein S18 acetylase RimI-like enzyme